MYDFMTDSSRPNMIRSCCEIITSSREKLFHHSRANVFISLFFFEKCFVCFTYDLFLSHSHWRPSCSASFSRWFWQRLKKKRQQKHFPNKRHRAVRKRSWKSRFMIAFLALSGANIGGRKKSNCFFSRSKAFLHITRFFYCVSSRLAQHKVFCSRLLKAPKVVGKCIRACNFRSCDSVRISVGWRPSFVRYDVCDEKMIAEQDEEIKKRLKRNNPRQIHQYSRWPLADGDCGGAKKKWKLALIARRKIKDETVMKVLLRRNVMWSWVRTFFDIDFDNCEEDTKRNEKTCHCWCSTASRSNTARIARCCCRRATLTSTSPALRRRRFTRTRSSHHHPAVKCHSLVTIKLSSVTNIPLHTIIRRL